MKAGLNWISLYTDVSSLLKEKGKVELAHLYSIHTAEIDDIIEYGKESKVLIGKIVEASKHPDSDHLNVVQVNLGDLGVKQIVCGAENVTEAKYVAVATVGSILKGDFEIKLAKLRGQESNGMICSEDELDFQEERAPGIMKLEEYFDENLLDSLIGKPFYDLEVVIPGAGSEEFKTKLSEVVFEIDNKFITNRPDLFSIEGNAREFSAIFDLPFTPYQKSYKFENSNLKCKIECEKVYAYQLLKIENVASANSPFGIAFNLYKSGINSKFDLVDLTNYIMTELGQPMHAFDADKIEGDITVRFAKKGEKLLALNNETYELEDTDIVIADDKKVLAIGGIMGGLDSAISSETKNIYLESACFHPTSIRLTAQRLGLRSDSSTRYEKSLDPLLTYRALARGLDILTFLKKDYKVVGEFEYLDKKSIKDISIEFTTDFISKKIGIKIPDSEINRILTELGFYIKSSSGNYVVKVPSFRATKDISIKEDIAEEIGRVYSYDKVPEIPLSGDLEIIKSNKNIEFKKLVKDYFTTKSFFEVYNYSFSNEMLDEKIGIKSHEDAIKVINAYSNEFTIYRRFMVPNLLQNIAENKNLASSFSFFEIGKTGSKVSTSFQEKLNIAGISYSNDFAEFKSKIEGLLNQISKGINATFSQGLNLSSYSYMHPNKSGEIKIQDVVVGIFGYINPSAAVNFDLDDSKLLYFELNFEKLLNIFNSSSSLFKELPKYPGIDRELNFVMDEKIPSGDIVNEIKKINTLIKNIKVIDIYRSKEKLGENKKSVSFSILLQDYEKTITDDDAMEVQTQIIEMMKKQNILIRS